MLGQSCIFRLSGLFITGSSSSGPRFRQSINTRPFCETSKHGHRLNSLSGSEGKYFDLFLTFCCDKSVHGESAEGVVFRAGIDHVMSISRETQLCEHAASSPFAIPYPSTFPTTTAHLSHRHPSSQATSTTTAGTYNCWSCLLPGCRSASP